MLVDEHTNDDGAVVRMLLRQDEGGSLLLDVAGETLALPDGALAAVMRRYGKPLEESAPLNIDARLDLPDGASLERFRFLRRYDVIARDYLLYREQGRLPVCEMATSVSAALLHLARRGQAL